ncbi:hypothetical protein Tco_1005594 [Tanacetum coccineum]|uniref:Uncharacterized protein n=1 Tax=Tanacetum coccineum TaxID=301880 RepID=A0ABQ5FF56_9ASTR
MGLTATSVVKDFLGPTFTAEASASSEAFALGDCRVPALLVTSEVPAYGTKVFDVLGRASFLFSVYLLSFSSFALDFSLLEMMVPWEWHKVIDGSRLPLLFNSMNSLLQLLRGFNDGRICFAFGERSLLLVFNLHGDNEKKVTDSKLCIELPAIDHNMPRIGDIVYSDVAKDVGAEG